MKIILFGLLAVAGCATAPAPQVQPQASPAPVITTNAAAIEKARVDSAGYPYTEADIHFMTMMIGHHAQAVEISRWAPARGASPALLRLTERVINAQQDEIVLMQQWLLDRQKPAPGLNDAGHAHHMQMPGMLTPAQLEQLKAARGTEFDRLFLTFMIQHHKGAVEMVKELFRTLGAAQDLTVFKFANDVQVDQTTEVARMEQMLAGLTPNQGKQ